MSRVFLIGCALVFVSSCVTDIECTPIGGPLVQTNDAHAFGVDALHVYWVESVKDVSNESSSPREGVLKRVPLKGGDVESLARAPMPAETSIALCGNTVFWLSGASSSAEPATLYQVPAVGGEPLPIVQEPIDSFAVDRGTLYWISAGRLKRLELGTSSAEILAQTDDPEGLKALAAHDEHLFWAQRDETSGEAYVLKHLDERTETINVIGDPIAPPSSVRVDDERVWVASAQSVLAFSRRDYALVWKEDATPSASSLAVDGGCAMWTTFDKLETAQDADDFGCGGLFVRCPNDSWRRRLGDVFSARGLVATDDSLYWLSNEDGGDIYRLER